MTSNDQTLVPAPAQRINLMKAAPDVYEAILALNKAAAHGLDPVVAELVKIRASQLNGCAFCLDMHTHDASKLGLSEQKLHGIGAWRETPFFTARERAALALSEAVTRLGEHGVPDDVFDEAARHFDEAELARLIAMCITINAWNRVGVTTRLSPAAR
ncbi:carboxymuconolactone decarboxylase family protein [Streptomyces sp. SID13666]|uniref:carboxymuconolactone decarboxylase family protein n=1 Tax=Streptomyces TaxID=1883 RepID=UPI0011067A4A|nr:MULTISPECIES: carboxymuconolactone decarboxylase family protein [Streptomyces]MCZ4099584.1 carboxymuconolactone decarboxylase family protein [Streptomyces sp. H39-C1]NEA59977.1 carboxymuconolactone decarboxylase family protein [Streptomyces sp. SID13666]NEA73001.1 carboxymuconolactone decarboxylase family protein [Streptomyces sp. SID13588]QNA74909.1 carboxymuconolactone decarboxylase family protein [Streptomyces sp. So13.3]